MPRATSRMTSFFSYQTGVGVSKRAPILHVSQKTYILSARRSQHYFRRRLYHIYPSLLHPSHMGSPCTMAASAQSLTQVSIVGEREDIPPTSTVGLGVTEAALDVFSNFVEHLASNVGNTCDRAENMVATRSRLRRSVRFASAQTSVPDPCPAMLPTPLEAKVRAAVCAPSVIAVN